MDIPSLVIGQVILMTILRKVLVLLPLKRKAEIIFESRSIAEQLTLGLLETANDKGLLKAAFFYQQYSFLGNSRKLKVPVYDKRSTILKLCKKSGFTVWNSDMRLFVDGMLTPVVLTNKLASKSGRYGQSRS